MTVTIESAAPGTALGWVVAEGCSAAPSSPALLAEVDAAGARALARKEKPGTEERRKAVRDLLRHGTYKPTGRGKPASEYLAQAAAEGAFPKINRLVDINNLVSVETQLPISLIDLDLAAAHHFRLRWGREGEQYVFNPSGQVLDLRDLLLLARLPEDLPCATPVKDGQATKTHPGTKRVLGVVYAPASLRAEAEAAARRMADLLASHAGAAVTAGVR